METWEHFDEETQTHSHVIGWRIPKREWIPKMVFGFLGREWFKVGVLFCLFGGLLCLVWIAWEIDMAIIEDAHGVTFIRTR